MIARLIREEPTIPNCTYPLPPYYFFGRGIGMFRGVADLDDGEALDRARSLYRRSGATPDTVESIVMRLRAGRM